MIDKIELRPDVVMEVNTSQARHKVNYWVALAVFVLSIIMVSGIIRSFYHPYGTSWDEAEYLNEAQIDSQRLHHGMIPRLAGRILIKSLGRPPAYRLLALPVSGLLGFGTTKVRLVSVLCLGVSSLFVYLATRRVASQAASAFAVLIVCLSPEIVSASIWFSTEGPLYLSTSGMLYYVLSTWDKKSSQSRGWICLGIMIGLGLLAKASFLAIALPVMLFWLLAGLRHYLGIGNLAAEIKAGLLASVIALPWWILNIKAAIFMAGHARGFVANSLGPPSIGTWMRWLSTVYQSLLGYGLSILILLIVSVWMYKRVVGQNTVCEPAQQATLFACICAGAPIVFAQLSGTNHLLRHISPAVIPLAIGTGVLVGMMGWDNARWFMVFSSVLFLLQLLMIIKPVLLPNMQPLEAGFANASLPWHIMARRDQWDWTPLEEISRDCGLQSPKIAYLGVGPAFNPPQIERPWAAAVAATNLVTYPYPDVRWLWRYEEGPIDWQKVTGSASESDIALTAPHFVGDTSDRDDLDNQHNLEFADRLSQDPHFQKPIDLKMGRFEQVDILVFVRQGLACQSESRIPVRR